MTIPSLSRGGRTNRSRSPRRPPALPYTSASMLLGPLLLASQAAVLHEAPFTLEAAALVVARVEASCTECDWGRKGAEAAAVEVLLD